MRLTLGPTRKMAGEIPCGYKISVIPALIEISKTCKDACLMLLPEVNFLNTSWIPVSIRPLIADSAVFSISGSLRTYPN
jgi:hypothetical protein